MTWLPTFESTFLNGICRRIEARGKALKHQGKLTWETKQPDDFEWISFYFEPILGHYIICQLSEDNRASIFIRDRSRARRGRVLLAIKETILFDNCIAVVSALETTIAQSKMFFIEKQPEALERIRTTWSDLQVRIVEKE